jgi:hypothetical protein
MAIDTQQSLNQHYFVSGQATPDQSLSWQIESFCRREFGTRSRPSVQVDVVYRPSPMTEDLDRIHPVRRVSRRRAPAEKQHLFNLAMKGSNARGGYEDESAFSLDEGEAGAMRRRTGFTLRERASPIA